MDVTNQTYVKYKYGQDVDLQLYLFVCTWEVKVNEFNGTYSLISILALQPKYGEDKFKELGNCTSVISLKSIVRPLHCLLTYKKKHYFEPEYSGQEIYEGQI